MVKTRSHTKIVKNKKLKRCAKIGSVFLPEKRGYTTVSNMKGTGKTTHKRFIHGNKKKQLKKIMKKKLKCARYECEAGFEVSAHVTCENDGRDYIVPMCARCNNPKRYKPFWVSPYIEMALIETVYSQHPSKPIGESDILV
tara:strand:+ start:119 stop:541 length:423 start_codon:yes stop_codon:yes gene_type:complete